MSIKLRGHHVAELARYYFSVSKLDFNPVVKSLFDELLSNDSNSVDLVEGLDSICMSCDHVDKSCSVIEQGDEDSFILGEYGLVINRSVKLSDLIVKLINYRDNKDNKYLTPTPVFYELNFIDDSLIKRMYSKDNV